MPTLSREVPRTAVSRRLISLEHRQSLVGIAFVLPAFVFFALFNFYPTTYALYLSFTEWDFLTPPRWVGAQNYTALFSNPDFLTSLGITLRYTIGAAVPLVLLSLGLALLLNQRLRFTGLYQAIYFVPVVMPAVVSAVIWGLLYQPTGPVNNILGLFGIDALPWLASTQYALLGIIIVSVWSLFGYDTLILLAGLQSIPPTTGRPPRSMARRAGGWCETSPCRCWRRVCCL